MTDARVLCVSGRRLHNFTEPVIRAKLHLVTRPQAVHHTLAVTAALTLAWGCGSAPSDNGVVSGVAVAMWQVPAGGRLPQAVVDDGGTVHLVYFQGEAPEGDLMYATRTPGAATWSEPMRVNSEPGSVTGIGPIDGGHLALGRDDRLHVTWFRIRTVEFFYTRTTEDGTGFEPQFGVAAGSGAEAAPSLAADAAGNVFMFWHDGAVEDAHRSVYMTVSHDDGLIWDPARPVSAESEGACNCCSLRALSDTAGTVYVSYRGARDNVHRDQRLLTSRDEGRTFSDELIHPWELGACPVSTTALSQGPSGPTVAWETEGQVYFASVGHLGTIVAPTGSAQTRRKSPAVAVNHRGETLVAWSDGPGIRSGGTLHWQLFDPQNDPISEPAGGADTIPDGSVSVALARPDGTFVVIH